MKYITDTTAISGVMTGIATSTDPVAITIMVIANAVFLIYRIWESKKEK